MFRRLWTTIHMQYIDSWCKIGSSNSPSTYFTLNSKKTLERILLTMKELPRSGRSRGSCAGRGNETRMGCRGKEARRRVVCEDRTTTRQALGRQHGEAQTGRKRVDTGATLWRVEEVYGAGEVSRSTMRWTVDPGAKASRKIKMVHHQNNA